MSRSLQDLIPGLREADEEYRNLALEAFAGVEPKIAGVIEILPLTARMLLELEGAECALVTGCGRAADETDVALFLWRCSPHYERGNETLRRFFIGSLAPIPFGLARDDILAYLERALAGMPLVKNSSSAASGVSAWPSHLVHLLAKEYGWSEEYILDLPLRRLFQYVNRILESKDPDYRERSQKSMELRRRYLLNASTPAEAARN